MDPIISHFVTVHSALLQAFKAETSAYPRLKVATQYRDKYVEEEGAGEKYFYSFFLLFALVFKKLFSGEEMEII